MRRDRDLPVAARAESNMIAALERAVGVPETLLDVGCGNNSPILRFGRRPTWSVGVDLYRPWLEESRTKGIHDEYVEANILEIDQRFEPGQFQVVLACDVLEHFAVADGASLLAQMATIASDRVVVLTPNGFVPQGETFGNPFEVHRSGWTPKMLQAHGFEVAGLNGVRWLRGELGTARVRPRRVGEALAVWSQPFARRFPATAFHLLASKDV
jgi:ubiquinone/menaquinone biosynthesis C-methylase UbiE